MPAKVVVQDLHKRYGGVEAARGVSFEIADGEIFGLIGPNGAGKTTTIECLLGLRPADSGHLEVCGIDARRNPSDLKQKIGAALQTTALQDRITPREALVLFGSFYRTAEDPDALLERFALTAKADAPFDSLSGGQRQRLALALAFVNRPELVFLDEPTSGLDPQSRRELRDEILRMKQDRHTVLLTTHDLEEASLLCDRIAILDKGRIIASGTPRDLVARSHQVQSVVITTTEPIAAGLLQSVGGLENISTDNADIRFDTSTVTATLPAVLDALRAANVGVVELHVRKATLEDVFIELTGSALRD